MNKLAVPIIICAIVLCISILNRYWQNQYRHLNESQHQKVSCHWDSINDDISFGDGIEALESVEVFSHRYQSDDSTTFYDLAYSNTTDATGKILIMEPNPKLEIWFVDGDERRRVKINWSDYHE